jgi:glycosyltransferase involved in cell wall biosynthesis
VPQTSIILPIYRAEPAHLAAALAGLQMAALPDSEVLIGLDGPCPGAIETLLNRAQQQHKTGQWRVLQLPKRGLVSTLNALLEASDSAYIARHDADDFSLPDRFQRQLEALEARPDAAFCGTQITRCDANLRPLTRQRSYPTSFFGQLAYASCLNNPVAHPSLMLRRSHLGDLRYCEVEGAEDWQLYVQLWQAGHRSFNLKRSGVLYRMHGQQITARQRSWTVLRRLKAESLAAALNHHRAAPLLKPLHAVSKQLQLSERLLTLQRKPGA